MQTTKTIDELIIFDWDDTLMNTIPHLRAPLHKVLYDYVRTHLEPNLTREAFDAESDEFYAELRSTIMGWRLKHGQSADFERTVLKLSCLPMAEAVMAVLQRDEARLARLRKLNALGYTTVVLTHNDRDFCLPLMKNYGFDEFFPENRVYDYPSIGHYKTVEDSYKHVLEDLKREFAGVHMVDDSCINLKCAFDLGMKTHHVLGETPMKPESTSFVMYNYNSVDEFMDAMILRAA